MSSLWQEREDPTNLEPRRCSCGPAVSSLISPARSLQAFPSLHRALSFLARKHSRAPAVILIIVRVCHSALAIHSQRCTTHITVLRCKYSHSFNFPSDVLEPPFPSCSRKFIFLALDLTYPHSHNYLSILELVQFKGSVGKELENLFSLLVGPTFWLP